MSRDDQHPGAYGGKNDSAGSLGRDLCCQRNRDIFHEAGIASFTGDGSGTDHVDAAHKASGKEADDKDISPKIGNRGNQLRS